jgi:hypothetical protein
LVLESDIRGKRVRAGTSGRVNGPWLVKACASTVNAVFVAITAGKDERDPSLLKTLL